MKNLKKIKRALITVSDKSQLDILTKGLVKFGIKIISTGGTGKFLKELSIPYTPIKKLTGHSELFSGRIKTISFEIISALLFDRSSKTHLDEANKLGIKPIDLVVCNLYPFKKVSSECDEIPLLVENIDIGGVTLLRSGAKNFNDVVVCSSPNQYNELLKTLKKMDGQTDIGLRQKFSLQAFRTTMLYDAVISSKFGLLYNKKRPTFCILPTNVKKLRYGENPHQSGWFYSQINGKNNWIQINGKKLSYNNYLDIDSSTSVAGDIINEVKSRELPSAVVIVKHTNPCGVAIAKNQLTALKLAWAGDTVSSFGSVICFTEVVKEETAKWLFNRFIEIVIAPEFSSEAKRIFKKKKNLRLIKMKKSESTKFNIRSINGGFLVQTNDRKLIDPFEAKTKHKFNNKDKILARFGLVIVKYIKSNAIVLVKSTCDGLSLIGAGVGNPNRIVSIHQALKKAVENGEKNLSDSILISDAFLPFSDNVEYANKFNIKKIVQPGGSIKDKEIISICDKFGIAMVFTNTRHFKH